MPPKLTIGKVDFSAGVLGGYKESFYFGIAVNHLSRPDMWFYDVSSNKLNLRWTIHSGILIDFFQGMDGEDLRNYSISPNVVYVQQGKFHQINIGMYVNSFPIVGGLWLRHDFGNPDAIIFLLGLQQKNYKLGYSYDFTVSRLTPKSGGAHEISFTLLFRKHLDANRFHEMKNPDF